MEKVLKLSNSSRPCLTAFVHQAVPGQIFVEAKTLQDAACTALGIAELNSFKLRMVAEDKRTKILDMDPAPRPRLQEWVWLQGNTKNLRQYKGDLALVVGITGSNLLDLWLILHLNFNLGQDDIIPAAQLFNVDGVKASCGENSVQKKKGKDTFVFQRNEFSSQGYLILSKREMYICEEFEAIPTGEELGSFLGCNALLPAMLVKTHSRMESTKVILDDCIKVLSGTFCGVLGKVVGLTADEADIHLPSQDLIECLRIWELVREFRVGDHIRAQIGSEHGVEMVKVGWVTKVSGSHMLVFDSVDSSEVTEHSIFKFQMLTIHRSPLLPSILNFMKTRSLSLLGVPADHQSIGRQ